MTHSEIIDYCLQKSGVEFGLPVPILFPVVKVNSAVAGKYQIISIFGTKIDT